MTLLVRAMFIKNHSPLLISPSGYLFALLYLSKSLNKTTTKILSAFSFSTSKNTFYSVHFLKFWSKTRQIEKNLVIKWRKYRSRHLSLALVNVCPPGFYHNSPCRKRKIENRHVPPLTSVPPEGTMER